MDATPKLDLTGVAVRPLENATPIHLFRCGTSEIDGWVAKQAKALSDIRRIKIFCAHLGDGAAVQGFYSLSFETKDTQRLSGQHRQLASMPVVYITYIAVARSLQGQGLGSHLLIDALKRAYGVSEHVGFHGVALRSLNARTTQLYSRFGFFPIDSNPNPLMLLPVQALADLFSTPLNT